MKEYLNELKKEYHNSHDKQGFLNEIREFLHNISPMKHNPVDYVKWVKMSDIKANDYNPNNVALKELDLLHKSISHDGYTQPIVTIYDEKENKYVIIDGFHRYYVERIKKDLRELNNEYLPVTIIESEINDRMASTIRHNRARGKHSITGMSKIVFNMLDNGWTDSQICDELGMEAEELIRLKHITGFSKLFEKAEYRQAWESKKQLKIKKEWKEKHGETPTV